VRLFVALDLDDAARSAVGDEQRRLARALGHDASPRWVGVEQLHLTLSFLGEVSEAVVPAIVAACGRPIDAAAFELVLKGLGVFPPRGAPRALWVGVSAGGGAIEEIQRQVAGRVSDVGIVLERRPFHPHLTLGRWRSSRPADGRRALAADSREAIARVLVDHATLYQSRLGSSAPSYTSLARATLT
jgi:2'-5' RNA ligase